MILIEREVKQRQKNTVLLVVAVVLFIISGYLLVSATRPSKTQPALLADLAMQQGANLTVSTTRWKDLTLDRGVLSDPQIQQFRAHYQPIVVPDLVRGRPLVFEPAPPPPQ